jgi:hypothetical protein
MWKNGNTEKFRTEWTFTYRKNRTFLYKGIEKDKEVSQAALQLLNGTLSRFPYYRNSELK